MMRLDSLFPLFTPLYMVSQGHEHTNHKVRLPLALAVTVHICAKHHAGVDSNRSYTPDYGVNISKWLMAYIRRNSKGQLQNSPTQI